MNNKAEINEISISYLELRKAIGFLGVAFPVALLTGSCLMGYCSPWQSSISCYYHTIMRNVFEGVLWIFAIFLMFYRYEKKDNIATTIAGICALGVASCPTYICDCATCGNPGYENHTVGYFHFAFAATFFVLLSYISLCLFTKTDKTKTPTPQKLKRNKVYKTCGIIMLVCIVLIAVYCFLFQKQYPYLEKARPIFCLETISLWAFGTSWLIKGEFMLKDK